MQRKVGRVSALLVGAAVLASAAGATVFFSQPVAGQSEVPLHSAGVVLSADGEVSLVPPDDHPALYPDSRVLIGPARDQPRARNAARRQQDWLAEGDIPGEATAHEDMARAALLDLETLVQPNGAALAGWSRSWRYVWPRDAAFTVAALSRTGHAEDAFEVLAFLQAVQEQDGRFQARYLQSGTGDVPDNRGIQLDGAGWVLWGAREWFDSFEAAGPAPHELRAIEPLIRRSTRNLIGLVDPVTGLPPASSDYWERNENALTLGTAAPVLAGLRAAPTLLVALGEHQLARDSRAAARRLDASIHRTFGARGYPRVIDGFHRDAAVAFMLPPFAKGVHPDVHRAWIAAGPAMQQPAGGVSPGVGWKKDGISWTPETALFALAAAASGETEMALAWISWLDAHRTSLGALPEKVSAQGEPGGVAPLAWTAALVVLTLDELESDGHLRRDQPIQTNR